MSEQLDGPVGVVRPGSWWRTTGTRNFGRDQEKIIRLLAGIAEADGGKKTTWRIPPLPGGDGSCPSHLADAIWTFQSHWKSKGQFRNIDGVVDPGGNTLKMLNSLYKGAPGPLPPGPKPPEPQIVDEWFVTDFGGKSESVVVALGYSALTGSITFERADGTKYTGAIGLFGLSAGVSLDPGKLPGMSRLLRRYPALLQWLGGGAEGANDLLLRIMQPGRLQRLLAAMPNAIKGMQLFNALKDLLLGGSIAPSWAPSSAIGLVLPFAPPLNRGSFSGSCLCYSLTGTVALGNGGTYVLFFGYRGDMYSTDFSLNRFTGCALIAAVGAQIQIPGLAATGTAYLGEIV